MVSSELQRPDTSTSSNTSELNGSASTTTTDVRILEHKMGDMRTQIKELELKISNLISEIQEFKEMLVCALGGPIYTNAQADFENNAKIIKPSPAAANKK